MDPNHPELQDKLQELEHELEEGDITEKGYQKRRTMLLSQYLGASAVANDLKGLRIHSPDDTLHPSNDGSRSASLAALNANSRDYAENYGPRPEVPPQSPARTGSAGRLDTIGSEYPSFGNNRAQEGGFTYAGPPSQLRLGVHNPTQRKSYGQETFLPVTPISGGNSTDRSGTMASISRSNYAFNPAHQAGYVEHQGDPYESRSGTMMDSHGTMLGESQQGYFSDFAGQQGFDNGPHNSYGGPHRYSSSDAFSPTAAMAPPMLTTSDLPPPAALEYQMPLEPRDVPFAVYDPHDGNVPMSRFDNIAAVLRHRSKANSKSTAYWVLDSKGKEIASITWDKLTSRAEKVAQVIRDKSSLYRGDRVALIYRDTEIIDFAIALLGCFIAGVVAVPINDLEDYAKLNLILTSTQAHLALTTDNNLKAFQRDITTQKLNWPRGVEWWKTNEFGSFHPKKKDDSPALQVPDLAYIEFSRAPTGDLRGVVMSHRTIMHQMACLSAIFSTVPSGKGDTFHSQLRDKNGRLMAGSGNNGEILLSYLDPRQGIGMILGVLLTVYGGHTTVWMENKAVETPGLYAHLITKYKATLMLADYPGLKRAAYNYQQDPMTTRNFKKGQEPNFQHVKLCLIDALTVDSEFHEVLADRWLRPMRNPRARELVAPMLCLPEHGGMVISMRDWLGGEERMGCPLKLDMSDGHSVEEKEDKDKEKEKEPSTSNGFASLIGGGTTAPSQQEERTELSEVLLDREALKTNEVVVVAIGEEARKKASGEPGCVRVGAFGFPIPDATLAVVDPETGLLATPHSVGEIWVDSPSLSGGFWALPKHTEQIFHARPYKFAPGDPTPMMVEPEFLRTGLLGTVIEGKIFVLGLYEDRIRQKVEWVEHGHEIAEHRYFFVQHIIVSIMKNVPKIYDCSAFDVFVNDEHLPIVLLESQSASTAPATSGGPPRQLDTALLDSLSERCMEVLMQEHHLRVYCVMITAPNTLPKVLKNGRREIGNMLCRREFDLGNLPCVHVKFGVERAVLNLPIGVDPIGGIWSPLASQAREDILSPGDKQYSGIDRREVVIDDRTSTPLNNFSSIVDLLQWRVARQAEELSYCTIDGRGKEGKGITWKKFDTKVAAVAMYLKNKVKIRAGDHLILMYTHSEDFVYAVHACFCLGATAIPMAPLDQNRLNEDAPAYLHMVADYGVRAVLVNQDVDHLMKQKAVSQHVKQSAQVLKVSVPSIYNTTKPPKQNSGCRDLGLTMQPTWVQPGYPVLVWTYWTPDQRRIAVQLGHDTIMGMCKVQKETCQMTSSRPVLGCVRSTSGLGFIHTCLMGVFVGAPTYLVSPVEFAQNPVSLFLTLSRYKIKDTYATPQMLDHAMAIMPGKGFQLHELKNMMISAEGRPRVDVFQKVRLHFAQTGLDRTAINTIYSHVLNPMIASRSYMCIEPIELWLGTQALRRGMIYPVDPESEPKSLLVQDSGMVPVSTQIAIVNPESRTLCYEGEYGEIWVESEACVRAFYGSKDPFDAERFDGRTLDGDPNVQYIRTGDLGFLHNVSRPIGPNGAQVDMQVLFVLGNIGETFEINGLSHFPMDIEYSVEKCHRNIVPGGCAVFQAGGLIVVLVEVGRKAYLASIVPVIVNAILNEHQIVVDIVAFVNRGDFPRSRLGEKQRGKILASWVTRKMRTMAQFGIRDPESGLSDVTETMEPRSGIASLRNSSVMASSLRNVESAPQIIEEQRELERQQVGAQNSFAPLPTGISEMPAQNYDDSVLGSPRGENGTSQKSDDTPTDARKHHFELPADDYDPSKTDFAFADGTEEYNIPGFATSEPPQVPPPRIGPKPGATPQINLPAVEGREGDLWSLPSQQTRGGLRVQNASNDDDEDWRKDAIMHMKLAGR
ncbi:probable acyl CoA ligase-like protein [Phialocephala subalpina]|uniref:Probable acyl CoA ligase-like protein n=1 Tax=Phialocephala subalpina TaxID=576137 RepID=A0A1L7XM70_9HELO|nr:probable acyl CoA ligase-like protein [Phialocephala subalpina]